MAGRQNLKRIASARRAIGARILRNLPEYRFEGDERTPVTLARMKVKEMGIVSPAMIYIKRNEFTTDRFYLSRNGMFGADYVEFNYFNFMELREMFHRMVKEGILSSDLANIELLGPGFEYERYNYEFSFI